MSPAIDRQRRLMRRLPGRLAAMLLLLSGCEEAQTLEPGLVEPLRRVWPSPMHCRERVPVPEAAFRSEIPRARVCPGLVKWGVIAGLQLDVVRYGTIVEFTVDGGGPDVPNSYHGFRRPLGQFEGRVTRVLKGHAPLGETRFPAYFSSGLGGWIHTTAGLPMSGLVFLPVDRIEEPLLLGCIEGHFVPTSGGAYRGRVIGDPNKDGAVEGAAYLADIRAITTHLRTHQPGVLATQTADSEMVRRLADGGDVTMGHFLAEHCDWRVAFELLERPPPAGESLSRVQLGILEGLLRMRVLLHTKRYPAWPDADGVAIEHRLLRWAVRTQAFRGKPTGEALVAFRDVLSLVANSGKSTDAATIGLGPDERRAVASKIARQWNWPPDTGYDNLVVPWLRGEVYKMHGGGHIRLPESRLPLLDRCRQLGEESESSKLMRNPRVMGVARQ